MSYDSLLLNSCCELSDSEWECDEDEELAERDEDEEPAERDAVEELVEWVPDEVTLELAEVEWLGVGVDIEADIEVEAEADEMDVGMDTVDTKVGVSVAELEVSAVIDASVADETGDTDWVWITESTPVGTAVRPAGMDAGGGMSLGCSGLG
ncbi:hypothetical protein LPJ61_002542 [Coemansia biformis]|uniref:Uncharacterized protein n=1 Tax=Coemansia biformis TaxID=1286918 RepID=A0A9W7Y871_9FUNG|nr:hypothetical protein LPJ61_002542 [Coemansia biformis]